MQQTLDNVRALGIAAALTGPTVRGDDGTVRAHRAAIASAARAVEPVYDALIERAIEVAVRRGAVTPEGAERLRSALATPP